MILLTYPIAWILIYIAFYLIKHLYISENEKAYSIRVLDILPIIVTFFIPVINVTFAVGTILAVITQNYDNKPYTYNGIFRKPVNKFINLFNQALLKRI